MTPEKKIVWEGWLATRPAHIQEVARKFPSLECWRSTDNPGHYRVIGYRGDTVDTVTMRVVHGADSYLPGLNVLGVTQTELIRCGCGKWEEATDAAQARSVETMRILGEEHRANQKRN